MFSSNRATSAHTITAEYGSINLPMFSLLLGLCLSALRNSVINKVTNSAISVLLLKAVQLFGAKMSAVTVHSSLKYIPVNILQSQQHNRYHLIKNINLHFLHQQQSLLYYVLLLRRTIDLETVP